VKTRASGKNLEGSKPTCVNSIVYFYILDGEDFVNKAFQMGVKINKSKVEKIAMVKDLENARQNLEGKMVESNKCEEFHDYNNSLDFIYMESKK
jgi:site-specific DNA-adenine methylase